MTLKNSSNATSSAAYSDGPTPCDSLDGPTIGLFGQEVARVSRSVHPARESDSKTSGICGPHGIDSFNTTRPKSYLASRSRTTGGTMLWLVTWKRRVTPGGRAYYEQLVSERITSEGDCIGLLPTPLASDIRNRGSVNKTPSVTRRMLSGKQIGLSMLFDGKPCPMCVGGMMGYPTAWGECLSRVLATPSSRK